MTRRSRLRVAFLWTAAALWASVALAREFSFCGSEGCLPHEVPNPFSER